MLQGSPPLLVLLLTLQEVNEFWACLTNAITILATGHSSGSRQGNEVLPPVRFKSVKSSTASQFAESELGFFQTVTLQREFFSHVFILLAIILWPLASWILKARAASSPTP